MSVALSEQELTNQKGHPPALFILFFTEMWERFSYYGMRALLVLFLISSLTEGGWGWERKDALQLYGIYTGLVYLTPIFGGLIADKILGYRNAVILGALIMTIGHASMAVESSAFFYLGLGCLIIGNGLFKPNISSIVGQLYTDNEKKKDAAYTIFYMGINAGAFLGILLCGYIGEKISWSYGFGLAGVFMLFGLLQFSFAQKIFGRIGLSPRKQKEYDNINEIGSADPNVVNVAENRAFQKPMEQTKKQAKDQEDPHVVRDRIIVISVFAFFTIFFWWAFEQAGGSMTVFAEDYTDRALSGSSATTFKTVNTLLTVVPMIILTVVLANLFRKTFAKYSLSNIFLGTSFLIIWGIVIWMLIREFKSDATEVPASWFGILNSFFIISFAPLFSKIWESRFNPSGPVKFAIGLILLGIGFAILAYGGNTIPQGAKTASVSMLWLILAYLFHTLGELCVSPVGLSYVSKLAPVKLVGLMFGIWFIANFIANYTAGLTGSFIDDITNKHSISYFFLIFTFIPIAAGLIMLALNKMLKKKMHGIE